MHFTTIISLLAAGAAAAPAPKSLDLKTRIPMPTPSPSSSSDGIISQLPPLDLRRRQEAEKDPLDAYLETLDGDYDEEKSEAALDHYHDSLEEEDENTATTTTVAALAAETPVPETLNSTVPVETEKNATIPAEIEKNSTVPAVTKNETSSALPEPTDDALNAYLETLGGDYDEQKSEAALNHYHDSLEAKNKTSSAAPVPTKKAASKDALTRLNDAIPLKRQEFPEKPEAPSVKRQLDGLLESVPEAKKEDVATPEVSEKNVTTPAVPAVSEEEVAATATDAHNATSSAAGSTTAKASKTTSDGYYGINKHMAKLNKLPIGGLPIKRGIPTKINNEEIKAPEIKPEDIRTPHTGEKHLDAHPVAWTDVEDAFDAKTSRTSSAGQRGYKNMSKLDWVGLPFKRQAEDVAEALPNNDDDALDTPEVKSSEPGIDEKKLESDNSTLNETVSAVNTTGADTGKTITDGFHQVSKHADKVPVNVGLPIKH